MSRTKASISLPRDQFPHPVAGEWWYWNGLLKTRTGKRFAFMHCLFRVNPAKAGLPGKVLLNHDIYFSHVLWVNLHTGRRTANFVRLSHLSAGSFKGSRLEYSWAHPLRHHPTDTSVREVSPRNFHLQNDLFDLKAKSLKPPLLMGGTGTGKWNGREVFYYSLPRLRLTGAVQVGDRRESATGWGWHDHQWATVRFQTFHWTWFSLHLTGQLDLMVMKYMEGQRHFFLASLSDRQGRSFHSNRVQLTPIGKPWRSSQTHACYQLDWEIEVPQFSLSLQIHPEVRSQEMLFSLLKYWEGPVSARGTLKGRAISGEGFCELV